MRKAEKLLATHFWQTPQRSSFKKIQQPVFLDHSLYRQVVRCIFLGNSVSPAVFPNEERSL